MGLMSAHEHLLRDADFSIRGEGKSQPMNQYLQREGAGGICRRCKTPCLYTKSTCDNCGDRLPWADGVADTMGENCPRCAVYNPYIRSVCIDCDEQLPWHECAAAHYHAARNAKKEQKSLALTIVLTIIGVVWFMSCMIATLQAHRQ
jgi:hypothetical protein